MISFLLHPPKSDDWRRSTHKCASIINDFLKNPHFRVIFYLLDRHNNLINQDLEFVETSDEQLNCCPSLNTQSCITGAFGGRVFLFWGAAGPVLKKTLGPIMSNFLGQFFHVFFANTIHSIRTKKLHM